MGCHVAATASEEDLPGWLELSEWPSTLVGVFKERAGKVLVGFLLCTKILDSLGPEAIFLGHDLIPPP